MEDARKDFLDAEEAAAIGMGSYKDKINNESILALFFHLMVQDIPFIHRIKDKPNVYAPFLVMQDEYIPEIKSWGNESAPTGQTDADAEDGTKEEAEDDTADAKAPIVSVDEDVISMNIIFKAWEIIRLMFAPSDSMNDSSFANTLIFRKREAIELNFADDSYPDTVIFDARCLVHLVHINFRNLLEIQDREFMKKDWNQMKKGNTGIFIQTMKTEIKKKLANLGFDKDDVVVFFQKKDDEEDEGEEDEKDKDEEDEEDEEEDEEEGEEENSASGVSDSSDDEEPSAKKPKNN